MELTYSVVTQFESDRDMSNIREELSTQAKIADEGGIDLITVGEHHATDDNYMLNEPVLTYLGSHSESASVGPNVCLLPYHNPVRIAEYGATMDHLTGGRFTLGVAQGYRPKEFEVFEVTRENAVGRLVEGVEIIKRLWTEDSVDYDGEYFQLENVSINPKPVQDPRPRILMGASNESSIRRAARIADGWVGVHAPFEVLAAQIDDYRDEREKEGLDEGYVRVGRELYVAESEEKALDVVQEPMMRKYSSYSDWGQDDVFEADTFNDQWEELSENRFIVGDPEQVVDEIERYRNELKLDGFGTRMQFKGMEFEQVESSLELYCEEVIPQLE